MNNYIFVTDEGYTEGPLKDDVPADRTENLQVLGYDKGDNPEEAFENFIKKNVHIIYQGFKYVTCIKLSKDYLHIQKHFSISKNIHGLS